MATELEKINIKIQLNKIKIMVASGNKRTRSFKMCRQDIFIGRIDSIGGGNRDIDEKIAKTGSTCYMMTTVFIERRDEAKN